jgi:hypothetical protein
LFVAPEPLASIVTVLFDTGLRTDECFRLRWESISWINGRHGTLAVTYGKSAAARRVIPMTPRVRATLENRWAQFHQGLITLCPSQRGYCVSSDQQATPQITLTPKSASESSSNRNWDSHPGPSAQRNPNLTTALPPSSITSVTFLIVSPLHGFFFGPRAHFDRGQKLPSSEYFSRLPSRLLAASCPPPGLPHPSGGYLGFAAIDSVRRMLLPLYGVTCSERVRQNVRNAAECVALVGYILLQAPPEAGGGESRRQPAATSSRPRRTRKAVDSARYSCTPYFAPESHYALVLASTVASRWADAWADDSANNLDRISGISKIARLSRAATFFLNFARIAGSTICRTPATTSQKLCSTMPTRFSTTHSAL